MMPVRMDHGRMELVIINQVQPTHQYLQEIPNFRTFAMRDLEKLEVKLVKIIVDLQGELVLDQAEDPAGL
jgi:hypothetical protein